MDLFVFLRFGYIIVIVSFLLMMWLSFCQAWRLDKVDDPPCYFNPLCSCSKNVPDLGIVRCRNIHLPKIPETINMSKVFMLHLENNGLRVIEPFFFQSTGLYKIIIRENPLTFIPDEAFLGLERSLWELDLSYNQLIHVPNRALRYLQKLRHLDLRGNRISTISPDNWRGLQNSLVTLILADNCINSLTTDLFAGLPLLETIDLSGNHLKEIDPSVFRDGMDRLMNLILSDNQLTTIPYPALSYLKMLKVLDLSYNDINKMVPGAEILDSSSYPNVQLNLDTLHLDYNQISVLESSSFQYFNKINKTYLDGNAISVIKDSCFRQAKIREIYMRYCSIKEISPEAFDGLENYLEILDLSGNHIEAISENISKLDWLKTFKIRDNLLLKIDPIDTFIGFQDTLNELDLSGIENGVVSLQDFRRLRNLRSLSLSRLSQETISSEDFHEYGLDLEELIINFANLKTIKNNAFKHIHGLRRLDLSENSIDNIENDAFVEAGSITTIRLSHALSSSMKQIPTEVLRPLNNVEELDLSNNKLVNLLETSFYFMTNLQQLYLQDNVIESIHKGTFQGDIHRQINEIYLSFNNIKMIQQHTFVDLKNLRELHLDDNKITTLETRAFMNLDNLRQLNLRGNKIKSIPYETFQNLPELEDLDISYNDLETFDFSMLDQVGTLSILNVNVSYNQLDNLIIDPNANEDPELGTVRIHSNIKTLDISHNNISAISKQFFRPVELSLTHLYLGYNRILNATKDVFGNMLHLQVLDISHNRIYGLDFDVFRNTRKLQVLSVSHNLIAEMPNDLFRYVNYLRIVDFSHNRLRTLPDNLFRDDGLEYLDISHNLLSKLPLTSFSIASASSLCELDLSRNSISSLSHGGLFDRFKKLTWLDLSYNHLAQIDAGTFKGLSRLSSLNLGHNNELMFEHNGSSFQGLEYSLLELNLDNISLTTMPLLPTNNLLYLSLAHNSIPTIPPEISSNISTLQSLNLNDNDLTSIPIVTHSLIDLKYLSLSNNPIISLTNTSLLGVAGHLEELDFRNSNLTIFETGAFCKMHSLRTLKTNLPALKSYNLPKILEQNDALKNLEIHVEEEESEQIDEHIQGVYPRKLQNISLIGKGFKKLNPQLFEGIRSPSLQLNIYRTSITKVPADLFKNLNNVQNISVDVRNNPLLKTLQNPSTGNKPNLPRATFLIDLKLSGSKWTCDCELGWVEFWQRKQRQYLCHSNGKDPSLVDICSDVYSDLRTTKCPNRNNQSLIEVLKTDLECGWSSGNIPKISILYTVIIVYVIHGALLRELH